MEELISICMISLIKAIESYYPNKGSKLASFAERTFADVYVLSYFAVPR